ncbi:hypothetical protein PRIC1_005998 [Phytophthora ramorum]|uniref:uncharacterized protein n=1 Tax=Phytophthora ramorum TaxID=164328 RepID=UPI0030B0BAEA|nr:hypothetical protein KRP23_13787 [Phytophthora ramorum]KAH7506538.1 hypothetical protein KRP22_4501 [Phytophthora ramorum]
MRGLLRRFHRAPSSKAKGLQETNATATSSADAPQWSSGRRSKFRLSSSTGSDVVHKAFVRAIKPVCESPETPTRSRKRDRLKNYLSRRRERETKSKDAKPYLWPAILSADKEELRSSDDTEDGDVYMLDYQDDSDSDEDEDSYVTPPVAIPEMYRRQDRLGGVTVAGARVLFTYAGFKRQQMLVSKLQSVPENGELLAPMGLHREYIVIGAF